MYPNECILIKMQGIIVFEMQWIGDFRIHEIRYNESDATKCPFLCELCSLTVARPRWCLASGRRLVRAFCSPKSVSSSQGSRKNFFQHRGPKAIWARSIDRSNGKNFFRPDLEGFDRSIDRKKFFLIHCELFSLCLPRTPSNQSFI